MSNNSGLRTNRYVRGEMRRRGDGDHIEGSNRSIEP